MNYKIDRSEIVFSGKVFKIKVDEITYDSGNAGKREVVLHNGGSVVLPITDEGKVVLVKQYRYPFEKTLYELPAGKLETGEDPLLCASRELQEETGYKTNNIIKLGSIYTTPGFCSEELHIFLATNLIPGDHAREEGEYGMELHEFEMKEVVEMILDGRIKDSKTIAGIAYYKLRS